MAVVFAAALKMPASWIAKSDLAANLAAAAPWGALVTTILSATLAAAKSRVGPPWLWDAVHHFLQAFRTEVFGPSVEAEYENRVTLFKRRQWAWVRRRWPGSGWIVPIERSGHTTHQSGTYFMACDSPARCEGVAGQTWVRNVTIPRHDLPAVGSEANPSDEDYKRYADTTWVSEQWIRDHRPRSRSLVGIPVEVKKRVWGVLVLDSSDPEKLKNVPTEKYQMFLKYLSKLLEQE